jgi:hypothetical protein
MLYLIKFISCFILFFQYCIKFSVITNEIRWYNVTNMSVGSFSPINKKRLALFEKQVKRKKIDSKIPL